MADKSSQKLEHPTESKSGKRARPKSRKTVKVTVEFDQDAVTDGIQDILAKISGLIR